VVTLNYHFALFREAGKGKRLGVTISVEVPKTDPVMPSLWGRIPGVEYSEREMREMLGIDFDGLPNKALVFLPEDWNEDIKPWRRDETGPSEEDVRELS
jgi:membrane-bound hydrogenase subunit beta